MSSLVDTLEREPSREGSIANDGNYEILISPYIPCD